MFTKYFLKLTVCFAIFSALTAGVNTAVAFDSYSCDNEPPSTPVTIRAKTFLKVINLKEINSGVADIDDRVMFLNQTDFFIGEYNAIPANSKFYGTVKDVREPVRGNNGAIKIKISKIVTPNDDVYYTNAYIYSPNDNYLGGGATPCIYYRKVPHYTKGWGDGVLQYAPTNFLEFGKPHKIKAGEELFVILEEDLKIY